MGSLRRLARMCRYLTNQHVDELDVPDRVNSVPHRIRKNPRETEDYLNEMPGVLAVFGLDEAPH